MARIFATHDPFLQSNAQVLLLPVCTDGNILHPVLARCKSLFIDNYNDYRTKAITGELTFGDVLLNKVPKQLTGLGVQTGMAEYIANLLVAKSVEQRVSTRTLTTCLQALKPQLYQLMRYQGVRRVAFIASPLLLHADKHISGGALLDAQGIIDSFSVLADIPKLTIEVHYGRDTPLPNFHHTPQKSLESYDESR